MSYQILDIEQKPIMLDVLNKLVADIWNKPFNPNIATRPFPSIDTVYSSLFEGDIWADRLQAISDKYGSKTFSDLSFDMFMELTTKAKDNDLAISSIEYNQPYFKLITIFEEKGYTFNYIDQPINTDLV